jgi:putative transposase
VIQSWRRHYNEVRPHSSLGYLTPAAFVAGLGAADGRATGRGAEAPEAQQPGPWHYRPDRDSSRGRSVSQVKIGPGKQGGSQL